MAVIASATGAAVFGLGAGTLAAGLAGGALLGAGAGALYSGITGDGNILNSALTGGLIGGAVGGIGAALAPAASGAVTGATGATTPALAAQGAGGTMGGISAGGAFTPSASSAANFALPSLSSPASYGGYTALGEHVPANIDAVITGNTNPAGAFSSPKDIGAISPSSPPPTAFTGKQKLAAGLGATSLLSYLGGQNQPTLQEQESESYIRPYTYSQKRNPNYGLPGEPYFTQSYEAQEPYKAASGGIMRMANGGAAQPIVPMQQLAAPVNTYTAPQRPVSQAVTDYNQLLAQRAQNEYNVQPAPLATLPGGGERAGAADTQKIINQYYLSNLGRQGEQSGLEYWANRKAETGMSLADIQNAIKNSPEGIARQPKPEAAKTYFDPKYYLEQNPDITRVSEYRTDPFAHYKLHGFGEGRAGAKGYEGKEMLGMAPVTKTQSGSGYTYNPLTKQFTAPTPAVAAPVEGLPDLTNDPGFLSYMQNQYRQYQNQSSGGGAAGGLMPAGLKYAMGGNVQGYNLGGYSDGGRLLRGPGDGVSDDIPAVIGNRQPARLADGEFVIPARIVSEIGNGSTDAGAKRLYAMMDRIQAGRKKTVGKGNVAKDTKAKKHLLA